MQRLEDRARLDNVDQIALLCDVSANTRLDSLSDLTKHKTDLRVRGGPARKVSVIDARRFARHCLLRCWIRQMDVLAPRLICSRLRYSWSLCEGDGGAGPGQTGFHRMSAAGSGCSARYEAEGSRFATLLT